MRVTIDMFEAIKEVELGMQLSRNISGPRLLPCIKSKAAGLSQHKKSCTVGEVNKWWEDNKSMNKKCNLVET